MSESEIFNGAFKKRKLRLHFSMCGIQVMNGIEISNEAEVTNEIKISYGIHPFRNGNSKMQ